MTNLKMDSFSMEDRIKMIQVYYKMIDHPKKTFHAFRSIFGIHNRLNITTISRFVKKFEETGSVLLDVASHLT